MRAAEESVQPPHRRVSRALVAAAACLLVVGIAGTWAIARGTTVRGTPSCRAVVEQVAKVWNGERRGRVIAATQRSAALGATGAEELAKRFDRWTNEWVRLGIDVCRQPEHTSAPEDRRRVARQQCLEQRLSQLDALLNVFGSWDQPIPKAIESLLRDLGDAADCLDADSHDR